MLNKEIKLFVAKSILSLKKKDLLYIPHPNMPIEMINSDVNQKGDWIPWKDIESTVTVEKISELEKKNRFGLPKIIQRFL